MELKLSRLEQQNGMFHQHNVTVNCFLLLLLLHGIQKERTLKTEDTRCHRHPLSLAECDPPGLTAPGGSEDTQDVLPEDQGMETGAKTFPDTGSDLRLPETSRSEPTKRTATDLDELPEELRREHKSQAIGFVGVCAITVGDTDVPIETNVDHQELRDEMRLTEPQLFKTETQFPEEY